MLTSVLRGLAVASLAVLPLTVPAPVHAAETLPLAEAVTRLPVDTESRDGYSRDAFRHWNTGDDPSGGCNTRAEVLLAEAVEPPVAGPDSRHRGPTAGGPKASAIRTSLRVVQPSAGSSPRFQWRKASRS